MKFCKKKKLVASDKLESKQNAEKVRAAMFARGVSTTDNASTALLSQVKLAKIVADDAALAYDEAEGSGAFEKLSAVEQKKVTQMWGTTCFRHLFNTFIDGGCNALTKHLMDTYYGELNEAKSENLMLRLTFDLSKVLHALAKEVGVGKYQYAKGEGKAMYDWLKEYKGDKLYITIARMDMGTRQDIET